MFTQQIVASDSKNLKNSSFNEKAKIEAIIDELTVSAKDPYTASLPLIASAELGDEKRYEPARKKMLAALDTLDQKPDAYPQWMKNNSFKAWMQGRVLLAANNMNDNQTITQIKSKLSALLDQKITGEDNPAFFAWAWGYRAALNVTEYQASKKRMMDDATQLTNESQKNPNNHDALSNALWAWVMNLSASANANDKDTYNSIKDQIQSLTKTNSVTKGIEAGLLRTTASNDYPAWALAKIRLAAATMRDKELYDDIASALTSSIDGAKKADAKAEYILAVTSSELALLAGKTLHADPEPKKILGN